MQWDTRLKEAAIFYINSWSVLRKCVNFMRAPMEKFWFCVDSGEKVNFMGFLKMAGFHWFHEIYDSHGKMHSFCHRGNFYCSLQNFCFLCTSVPLTHIMHSGPLPHLVVSFCEYFTLLDGCIVLWSSDDRNPWLPTKEVQCADVGGGRAWKVRNTKYSPGDFVFYGNASLFHAI